MTSDLSQLVAEVSELARREYPDLPESMYIRKHDLATLQSIAGMPLPPELVQLYCTGVLVTEPWSGIMLYRPERLRDYCGWSNDDLVNYSPPMKLQPGVRAPIEFGDKLIPFAYHDDSRYCIDLAPDVAAGGAIGQVVNVSLRRGLAKVTHGTLEEFLRDGLKKMRREIKRRQTSQKGPAEGPSDQTSEPALGALKDPGGHWNKGAATFMGAMDFAHAGRQTQELTADERRERAASLTATNPKTTHLQRVCARLVELYAQKPELDSALMDTTSPMPTDARAKIERSLHIALPTMLQEFLDAHQRIGIAWDNVGSIGLDPDLKRRCKELASIKIPAERWSLWPGTAVPVFGEGLIPIGGDGDPVICLDLQPGAGGTRWQLVEVSFEETRCKVIATGLEQFLELGLQRLQTSRP